MLRHHEGNAYEFGYAPMIVILKTISLMFCDSIYGFFVNDIAINIPNNH
jgi:hypothetical protein